MQNHENTSFTDSIDPSHESRAMTLEAVCRLFIWAADAPTFEDRGLRTTVILYCVRPDLIGHATLEEIGFASGRTRQHIHKLAVGFRRTIGLRS